ncbi:terminase small subunit [Oceaniglobus ichthyenteri]|uniref:terminase small subunit n=1 Tax=Oceaniglobus ichthyenteri TaxID=2136177 RepID=UPI000D37BD4A|nr:terminase small subunit [Oceaniglobus ichthyenteri]
MEGKDPATGYFLPGNKFWAQSSTFGRKPTFENPEQLRAAAVEYFEWVTENPLIEEKLFSYEGQVARADTGRMHAMTIGGLCLFLDISVDTWRRYRSLPEFEHDCQWVESVIFTQKFTGAAAGLLNAAIVARELGLADKKDHTSSDGTMTPKPSVALSNLTDKELAQLERLTDKATNPAGVGEAD